jgi:gamma-glutamylaminecyclotransferase
MNQTEELVFVYGSLLSGLHNHGVLQAAGGRLIGTGSASGRWLMFDCGRFPAVVPTGPGTGGIVPGQLYALAGTSGLMLLDRLEDHPREYRRVRVKVRLDDSRQHTAWMYVYQLPINPDQVPVPGNDWRAYGTAAALSPSAIWRASS